MTAYFQESLWEADLMGMAEGDLVDGHGVQINPSCADTMRWCAGVCPGAKQSYGGLMCKSKLTLSTQPCKVLTPQRILVPAQEYLSTCLKRRS